MRSSIRRLTFAIKAMVSEPVRFSGTLVSHPVAPSGKQPLANVNMDGHDDAIDNDSAYFNFLTVFSPRYYLLRCHDFCRLAQYQR